MNGYLFFVYFKKGNKKFVIYVYCDEFMLVFKIDEEGYVDGSIFKFIWMVVFDEMYMVVGLKEVVKLKVKGVKKNNFFVDEYVDYVFLVVEFLVDKGDL